MQGTEQIIAVYQAGFIACLCLAVVFAALTIFIFFKLKIRQVFDFLTGREQRRTIKQMEQENAKTGKLREDTFIPGTTGDLYNHHDADGFITLFGLPLKVRAMKMMEAQKAKTDGKI